MLFAPSTSAMTLETPGLRRTRGLDRSVSCMELLRQASSLVMAPETRATFAPIGL